MSRLPWERQPPPTIADTIALIDVLCAGRTSPPSLDAPPADDAPINASAESSSPLLQRDADGRAISGEGGEAPALQLSGRVG